MTENIEDGMVRKRIGQFVTIRDRLKVMEDAHEKATKPLRDLQAELSGSLQEALTKSGGTSIATPEGTCYQTTRHTASLPDANAFMEFVTKNNRFDLLDKKANAPAVRDYVALTGNLPPGVKLTSIQTVGVRRA